MQVLLVDPRRLKSVPGRKTDFNDAPKSVGELART